MHITNRHLMGCLLWSALLSACAPPPGTAPQSSPALSLGEQVFQRCLTCHSDKNENRPTGPNLFGLLGRKAATREGYFYSEALRKANLTWARQLHVAANIRCQRAQGCARLSANIALS